MAAKSEAAAGIIAAGGHADEHGNDDAAATRWVKFAAEAQAATVQAGAYTRSFFGST
jgi:hypothetical protein